MQSIQNTEIQSAQSVSKKEVRHTDSLHVRNNTSLETWDKKYPVCSVVLKVFIYCTAWTDYGLFLYGDYVLNWCICLNLHVL